MAAVAEVRVGFVLQARVRVNQLKRAVKIVNRVALRGTLPLSMVRITSHGQGLVLETTDMEVSIQERIPAVITSAGSSMVPVHLLLRVVGLIPAGAEWVSISGDNADDGPGLRIAWDRSTYRLQAFDTIRFPDRQQRQPSCKADVEVNGLRASLERSLWAVSKDDYKPWLMGVRFTVSDSEARAVATNGCVIGMGETEPAAFSGDRSAATIPAKAVREMIAALRRTGEAAATITIDDMYLSAVIGATVITARTIEGEYPNVMRLVPEEWSNSVELDRMDLLAAMKRAAAVSVDGSTKVTMGPIQSARIEVSTPDVGEAVERLAGGTVPTLKQALTIGVNANYVINALSRWTAARVRMEFNGSRDPFRLSPADGTERCAAIILPLITY